MWKQNLKHYLFRLVILLFVHYSHLQKRLTNDPIPLSLSLRHCHFLVPAAQMQLWHWEVNYQSKWSRLRNPNQESKANQYWCPPAILNLETLREENFYRTTQERRSIDDSIWLFPSAWQIQHLNWEWLTLPRLWLYYLKIATPFAMDSNLFWKEAECKHTLHPSRLNFVSLSIKHYADQSDICADMVVTTSSPETLISKLARLLFFLVWGFLCCCCWFLGFFPFSFLWVWNHLINDSVL